MTINSFNVQEHVLIPVINEERVQIDQFLKVPDVGQWASAKLKEGKVFNFFKGEFWFEIVENLVGFDLNYLLSL